MELPVALKLKSQSKKPSQALKMVVKEFVLYIFLVQMMKA